MTTGGNQWDAGLDVVVEGDAVRVTDSSQLETLAALWATRWDGRFRFVPGDGCFLHEQDQDLPRVLVFAVTPAKVLVFTRGGRDSHTTHRL